MYGAIFIKSDEISENIAFCAIYSHLNGGISI